MQIINKISDMRDFVSEAKKKGSTIGLVPTMGYLHEGHLSLIRRAAADNSIVVTSIFVNPIQFGPSEDFDSYPRDMKRDSILAEQAWCDVIFAPSAADMYPSGFKTYVEVTDITEKLCGASRPGHFRGVTTVVAKLFNIIQPDKAYFGQKNAQQLVVIKRMAEDLNFPITIVPMPIVRESDGLAMSSRNKYLSPEERKAALVLSRALFSARDLVIAGERNKKTILENAKQILAAEPLAQPEYVELVDADTLADAGSEISGKVMLAIAAKIGKTRLIDNIVMEV